MIKETESEKRESARGNLQAVEGILQSAARLTLIYIAAKSIAGLRSFFEKQRMQHAQDEWTLDRARKDLIDTMRHQDEQDRQNLEEELRKTQVERERNKVRFRPKSVRGHWEGHVFIPRESPTAPPQQRRK